MKKSLFLIVLLFVVSCSGQTKEELVQEGDRLQQAGNYRGAVVLYKNALEKDANDLNARFGLANAYLESGRLEQAEKEFQKVLLQNPARTEILLKLATLYIQQKKPDQALLELDKYHSDNPETVDSLVLYGRAHGALGDLASAEKFFTQALSLDDQAIDPRLNLAKVHLQQQDPGKATTYLEQVIQLDPAEIQAYYLLAGIQTRQGQREAALQTYQAALQADENQVQALYMSGILQLDLGQLDAAAATVEKLNTRFADRPEGSRLEGMLLYRQGEHEQARIALENSLQKEQHLLSYFFLGLSYYGLEQFELALNQFQKALDLQPEFERARVLVGMTLLKQKRLDDAIQEIQKVLRANPDNAYARNILGSAYLANGDYDKGMAELEQATELDPSLVDAHMKRGLFHLSKGQGAAGEADLRKAVEAAPEVMNSRLMLVTHYLRQKNYSAAIDALKEGMNGSKADALLNNYLAAAYFSQKKPELALAALKKAREINPAYLTPAFNRASYYASQSEYDKAIAEYRSVLEQDSNNLRALMGMAALYRVQGDDAAEEETYQTIEATAQERGYVAVARYRLRQRDFAETLVVVDRGLGKYPQSAALLELKGGLHLERQEYDLAEAAYTELSGISPERGHSLLVRLYLSNGQPAQAQQLIDELLASAADQDYPYLLAAGMLANQRQVDEAVSLLERGIAAVAKPLRLQMQLGRLQQRQGNNQRAEQLYQRIIADQPRFAPAYTAVGFIREAAGNKAEALDYYRQALKYDQKNVPALNNLAYLLADNFGEQQEALNYALSAYRLQPSDPRIMDTLGYILVQNDRAEDALNLLEKALELLPEVAAVKLHLAQARLALGDNEAAAEMLKQVQSGGGAEAEQAARLLKQL